MSSLFKKLSNFTQKRNRNNGAAAVKPTPPPTLPTLSRQDIKRYETLSLIFAKRLEEIEYATNKQGKPLTKLLYDMILEENEIKDEALKEQKKKENEEALKKLVLKQRDRSRQLTKQDHKILREFKQRKSLSQIEPRERSKLMTQTNLNKIRVNIRRKQGKKTGPPNPFLNSSSNNNGSTESVRKAAADLYGNEKAVKAADYARSYKNLKLGGSKHKTRKHNRK
jgi:hypothetical protein